MRPDPTGDPPSFLDGRSIPEFEAPGPLLFLPLLFIQGGGMDLSKVGEKIISSVRSARSLGLLPSSSDRPEVRSFSVRLCSFFFSFLNILSTSLVHYDTLRI